MILTKQQKYAIREEEIYACLDTEKNLTIPQFSEILQLMYEKIKKAGFNKVERCSPFSANCIIRVYQDLHHEYNYDMCFDIYGAKCYTKVNGVWKTGDGIDSYSIRYDRHIFRVILCQDESFYVDADFVDYYVKII